jgi:hypothetical protein
MPFIHALSLSITPAVLAVALDRIAAAPLIAVVSAALAFRT